MPVIHPFRALLAAPSRASEVCCLPFDVMDEDEAREMIAEKPDSFLRVIRPDAIASAGENLWDVSRRELEAMIARGDLSPDDSESVYVYEEELAGRVQRGVVCACSVSDYENGLIRVHELTFPDRVAGRRDHFLACGAQTEPVFFFCRDSGQISSRLAGVSGQPPEYDFVDRGVRQRFWKPSGADQQALIGMLSELEAFYVADGHHRTRAAFEAGAGRVMAVIFPEGDLNIMPYNRLLTPQACPGGTEGLLADLGEVFDVGLPGPHTAPSRKGEFSICCGGAWRVFSARDGEGKDKLDADILQELLFSARLGITDPRTDPRLSFTGGLDGAARIEREVATGRHIAGIELFAVTGEDVARTADEGRLMPPKSTWFEPKLRSGLFLLPYEVQGK